MVKYKGLLYLVLLVVVAPALVWHYAVADTTGQWLRTSKFRRQIEELRQAQARHADGPGASDDDTEMILSGLLVNEVLPLTESEGLRIERFLPYVTSEEEGITLATGQLTVSGGFASMVKLLDRLEGRLPRCKIVSVHYRTSSPSGRSGTKTKTLTCTIYIQQIVAED